MRWAWAATALLLLGSLPTVSADDGDLLPFQYCDGVPIVTQCPPQFVREIACEVMGYGGTPEECAERLHDCVFHADPSCTPGTDDCYTSYPTDPQSCAYPVYEEVKTCIMSLAACLSPRVEPCPPGMYGTDVHVADQHWFSCFR